MPGDKQNDGSKSSFTRRQALRAAGIVSASTILAGCGGGGGDGDGGAGTPTPGGGDGGDGGGGDGGDGSDGGGGDGGDGGTPTEGDETSTPMPRADQAFRWSWTRGDLTKKELNPYSPRASGETQWHVYAMVGQPSLTTGEWVTIDTKGQDEGWMFDDANNEFHIEIKEDVHWHQGGEVIDDFTGEDFVMQDELQRLLTQANPEGSVAEDPVVTGYDHDGKTAIYQLNPDGYNKRIFPRQFIRSNRVVYREQWRELYEGLKDASTDDKMTDLRTQVLERKIRLPDDPPLSGPFMLDNVSAQGAEFTRNPEHWSVEHNNWDNYKIVSLSGGTNADYQAALNDRIDMNMGFPDTVSSAPDHLVEVQGSAGRVDGRALAISYGGDADPWFGFEGGPGEEDAPGKRQALARQAIGYQLNMKDVTSNVFGRAGKNLSPLQKAVPGDPRKVKDQFPDIYEAAPSFVEQQPDKAEEALRESGLSKQNGTWVKPNDKPLVIELESFSWSRDDIATITEDLKEIGLKAEHVTQEQGVLFSRLGGGGYAAAQSWFFGLDGPIAENALWAESGWPSAMQPNYYKIPPVGEYDADPTEKVDVRELASAVRGTPPEEHEEELRKLIWLYSYHQPQVHYTRSPNPSGFNRKRFKYPNYPEINERNVAVAKGDNAAPIWGADQAWRLVRRGLEQPNHIMAREQYM